MAKVARPIIVNVITSVVFRPLRSPMWPKTSPPTGRATNPTANEGERGERPRQLGEGGEEQPAEYQRRRRPENEEVVPLDGGTDHAGDRDAPHGLSRRRRTLRCLNHCVVTAIAVFYAGDSSSALSAATSAKRARSLAS